MQLSNFSSHYDLKGVFQPKQFSDYLFALIWA